MELKNLEQKKASVNASSSLSLDFTESEIDLLSPSRNGIKHLLPAIIWQ